MKIIVTLLSLLLFLNYTNAQTGEVSGVVKVDNQKQGFATVSIAAVPTMGAITKSDGSFLFGEIPYATYQITASFVGFKKQEKTIIIDETNPSVVLNFNLNESLNTLNQVVVTGTKTYKRQTNSPVIVNLITSKTLDNVQACNLSENYSKLTDAGYSIFGNYTQLRMNGLAGGYSQILINGRPIFSPLTGLYGLEQLPTNMIERIEVVRGRWLLVIWLECNWRYSECNHKDPQERFT